MNSTLAALKTELETTISSIRAVIPSTEPFNIAHGNWTFPGLTREDLAEYCNDLIKLIDAIDPAALLRAEAVLLDFLRRLVFLRGHTLPNIWGNAAAGVSAYIQTFDCLKKILSEEIGSVDLRDEALGAGKQLKALRRRIASLEAMIANVAPRINDLKEMIVQIEDAHETADQLPTELEALKESREQIKNILHDANEYRQDAKNALSETYQKRDAIIEVNTEAQAIIARCDEAYRATTSQGLAAAFNERSEELGKSMWVWVGGLIIALCSGAYFGAHQLGNLSETIRLSGKNDATLWVQLLLSLLSVGGPIWFAWISTKQIGQRFRLAEDYGYKASISKAYEGYRREAALVDPTFQSRLFSSALTRLDEVPLRLVEADTHGSPWHELASSDIVRQAIDVVPGFADQIKEIAKSAVNGAYEKSQNLGKGLKSALESEKSD